MSTNTTLDATNEGYVISELPAFVSGDSRRLRFTITIDGVAKDITEDTIRWGLFAREYEREIDDAVLNDDDDGVAVLTDPITDPSAGELEVRIDREVTADIAGEFYQRIRLEATGSTEQSWRGRVLIES